MSGDTLGSVTRRTRDVPLAPMEARVVETADVDAQLTVEVIGQTGNRRECRWAPRTALDELGAVVLITPVVGDLVLVVESDHGALWAIAWWPAAYGD